MKSGERACIPGRAIGGRATSHVSQALSITPHASATRPESDASSVDWRFVPVHDITSSMSALL